MTNRLQLASVLFAVISSINFNGSLALTLRMVYLARVKIIIVVIAAVIDSISLMTRDHFLDTTDSGDPTDKAARFK